MAYDLTAGCKADGGKWTTAELRAWLADQGIAHPEVSPWLVTLPNGARLGCRNHRPATHLPAAVQAA